MKKTALPYTPDRIRAFAFLCVDVGNTLAKRVDYYEAGRGDEKWLAGAALEEIRRLTTPARVFDRILSTDGIAPKHRDASVVARLRKVISTLA